MRHFGHITVSDAQADETLEEMAKEKKNLTPYYVSFFMGNYLIRYFYDD